MLLLSDAGASSQYKYTASATVLAVYTAPTMTSPTNGTGTAAAAAAIVVSVAGPLAFSSFECVSRCLFVEVRRLRKNSALRGTTVCVVGVVVFCSLELRPRDYFCCVSSKSGSRRSFCR